ncbi:hypothetical protein Tco_1531001 [Tanacetum coccineum]
MMIEDQMILIKPFAGRVKRELHDIESKDMDVVKEAERTREMGASFADISLDKGSGSGSAPAADVKVEQGNSNKPDPPASASEMNM